VYLELRSALNFCSTALLVLKKANSSAYSPTCKEGSPVMISSEKRHGLLFGELVSPRLLKNNEILLNQWMGDLTRPYRVFFRGHNVLGLDSGHPLGGRIITCLLSGNFPYKGILDTTLTKPSFMFNS